jgi:branched-chain amino acid transport system substrate-binding protein
MSMFTKRRLGLAAATSLALTWFAPFVQAQETIKVGVPITMSGPLSTIAEAAKRAVEFAIGEVNANGGVKGKKIEVRYVDTEGKPDVSRKQVEKLALEGYKLMFGTNSSGEGLVVAPMLRRLDALLVSPFSKSAKLIGDSCQARFFRTNQSDPMEIAVVKAWMKTRNEKKWVTIANDYAFGHDATEGFTGAAKSLGMEVVSNLFAPLGTNDYAPYIQQIKAASADGVFVILSGRDAINLLTQGKEFGLTGSGVMAGLIYTQDDIMAAAGTAGMGAWGNIDYSSTIDTPENKTFVEGWKAKYNGASPTDSEGLAYTGISVLLQAIQKSGSSDPAAVAKTLSGGTFTTPYGTAKIREQDHQILIPVYFGQVKEVDGKARAVVSFALNAEEAAPPVDPACKM